MDDTSSVKKYIEILPVESNASQSSAVQDYMPCRVKVCFVTVHAYA